MIVKNYLEQHQIIENPNKEKGIHRGIKRINIDSSKADSLSKTSYILANNSNLLFKSKRDSSNFLNSS